MSYNSELILDYSNEYRRDLKGNPLSLLQYWLEALNFFVGHTLYQGRANHVSRRIMDAVWKVIDSQLSQTDGGLGEAQLAAIEAELRQYINPGHPGSVGKGGDRKLVMGTLSFIQPIPQHNIVAYSVRHILSGSTREHYGELQRCIFQVGPTVASLYLRDVVSVFGLDAYVPFDDQVALQPIDVSVRRFAEEAGFVEVGAPVGEVQHAIVAECKRVGISPIQLNQGIYWANQNKLMDAILGRAPALVH